jgi:hypothetical protein
MTPAKVVVVVIYESIPIEVPTNLILEAQGNFVNSLPGLCESDCNDDGRRLFVEAQAEDVNEDVRRPIQIELEGKRYQRQPVHAKCHGRTAKPQKSANP